MKIVLPAELIDYSLGYNFDEPIEQPYTAIGADWYYLTKETHLWFIENKIQYKIINEKYWIKIVILDKKDAMLFKLV